MLSFSPPLLLRHGHVQTLLNALPAYVPSRAVHDAIFSSLATCWHRTELPGGGSVLGKLWWQGGGTTPALAAGGETAGRETTAPGAAPLAVLIHGIGGSSEAFYVERAAFALHRRGFHVLRYNMRGAGDSVYDAPSLYHAGLTSDLEAVVRSFADDGRVSSIALVGFSLGGNLVLKAAGEWGANLPPKVAAVASISAPTRLEVVSKHLETLRTLPYRHYVVRQLVKQARRFAEVRPGHGTYGRLDTLRTVRDYDDAVIVPMHDFASVAAYYESASSGPWLPRIAVPTLLLHAEDDPMVPARSVKEDAHAASDAVEAVFTERGGHVGWIAGPRANDWLDTWGLARVHRFLLDATA